ncbi:MULTISPECIES: hypothetical protein [unclassified Sinorhizobium]|nr:MULTISPECIES: hypothetical protein [unclassified Sinorhizobium]MDK1375874.1 hypothetical protein [Sinorhizobium sp. 6-70]MDK1481201.1 hypothetical protein [Sinorhizobium sp. 6-117]
MDFGDLTPDVFLRIILTKFCLVRDLVTTIGMVAFMTAFNGGRLAKSGI